MKLRSLVQIVDEDVVIDRHRVEGVVEVDLEIGVDGVGRVVEHVEERAASRGQRGGCGSGLPPAFLRAGLRRVVNRFVPGVKDAALWRRELQERRSVRKLERRGVGAGHERSDEAVASVAADAPGGRGPGRAADGDREVADGTAPTVGGGERVHVPIGEAHARKGDRVAGHGRGGAVDRPRRADGIAGRTMDETVARRVPGLGGQAGLRKVDGQVGREVAACRFGA